MLDCVLNTNINDFVITEIQEKNNNKGYMFSWVGDILTVDMLEGDKILFTNYYTKNDVNNWEKFKKNIELENIENYKFN